LFYSFFHLQQYQGFPDSRAFPVSILPPTPFPPYAAPFFPFAAWSFSQPIRLIFVFSDFSLLPNFLFFFLLDMHFCSQADRLTFSLSRETPCTLSIYDAIFLPFQLLLWIWPMELIFFRSRALYSLRTKPFPSPFSPLSPASSYPGCHFRLRCFVFPPEVFSICSGFLSLWRNQGSILTLLFQSYF